MNFKIGFFLFVKRRKVVDEFVFRKFLVVSLLFMRKVKDVNVISYFLILYGLVKGLLFIKKRFFFIYLCKCFVEVFMIFGRNFMGLLLYKIVFCDDMLYD